MNSNFKKAFIDELVFSFSRELLVEYTKEYLMSNNILLNDYLIKSDALSIKEELQRVSLLIKEDINKIYRYKSLNKEYNNINQEMIKYLDDSFFSFNKRLDSFAFIIARSCALGKRYTIISLHLIMEIIKALHTYQELNEYNYTNDFKEVQTVLRMINNEVLVYDFFINEIQLNERYLTFIIKIIIPIINNKTNIEELIEIVKLSSDDPVQLLLEIYEFYNYKDEIINLLKQYLDDKYYLDLYLEYLNKYQEYDLIIDYCLNNPDYKFKNMLLAKTYLKVKQKQKALKYASVNLMINLDIESYLLCRNCLVNNEFKLWYNNIINNEMIINTYLYTQIILVEKDCNRIKTALLNNDHNRLNIARYLFDNDFIFVFEAYQQRLDLLIDTNKKTYNQIICLLNELAQLGYLSRVYHIIDDYKIKYKYRRVLLKQLVLLEKELKKECIK